MNQSSFAALLESAPLLAILRGMPPAETAQSASLLWANGVRLVEVPLHSPSSQEAFRATLSIKPARNEIALGVGSVRNMEDYKFAQNAGADFTVSPGLFPELCSAALSDKMAHLPGVCTPTELGRALEIGFREVKLFPASVFGPAGLAALLGPFPTARIVAVGGVDEKNCDQFMERGAFAVGIGNALDRLSESLPNLLENLTQNTRNH